MKSADHPDSREFPLGSGRGLERKGVHAGDLAQVSFQVRHDLKAPLRRLIGKQRVGLGEPIQARDFLVDLGVVLHGAGPQRVEPFVIGIVELRKAREVAHHFALGKFGKTFNLLPSPAPIQLSRHGPVPGRDIAPPLPRDAPLKKKTLTPLRRVPIHAHSTSSISFTSRSIWLRLLTSVTQISRSFFRSGKNLPRGSPTTVPLASSSR